MISFEGVLFAYAMTIRLGILKRMVRAAVAIENEHLYQLCMKAVDGWDCSEEQKAAMRNELAYLKETLAREIEHAYGTDLTPAGQT